MDLQPSRNLMNLATAGVQFHEVVVGHLMAAAARKHGNRQRGWSFPRSQRKLHPLP